MEKFYCAAASGRGGAESSCVVDSSGNKKTTQPKMTFSFFPFYFGSRKWRNLEQLRRRGEAEPEQLRRRIVGEEEDHPTQNDVVLGRFDFFFLNQNTAKRRRFRVTVFFKIIM